MCIIQKSNSSTQLSTLNSCHYIRGSQTSLGRDPLVNIVGILGPTV